jgi:hypothetical protein
VGYIIAFLTEFQVRPSAPLIKYQKRFHYPVEVAFVLYAIVVLAFSHHPISGRFSLFRAVCPNLAETFKGAHELSLSAMKCLWGAMSGRFSP